MGLLPIGADILPPSDDRVFKLLMTSEEESKPVLAGLISATIGEPVLDVVVRNNELPSSDTEEKDERFDVNCQMDQSRQADVEMQASSIQETPDGKHENLKGKGVYYLCAKREREEAVRSIISDISDYVLLIHGVSQERRILPFLFPAG